MEKKILVAAVKMRMAAPEKKPLKAPVKTR
ncbi:unnamed protein product [Cylicostephanus goldi]|uniref:Uncharacterized protein n=1 Tax=Cylicostephanus goldi TaxID=71465 RepID=A0A3P7QV82_CYLGO|nr:unnamed protein product [Cylicostephanus goldi]